MQYKKVNNIQLHVVEKGTKNDEVVILLHGFPDFWYGWSHQISFLATQGYRVIVPDQRGYNLSDKPRGVRNYHLDILAADIIALIDSLRVEKVNIIGHDWGGGVAWWLATKYPQRIRKLIILNMPHLAVLHKYLLSNIRQMLRSWYMFAFQIPFLPEKYLYYFNSILKNALINTPNNAFSKKDITLYEKSWSNPHSFSAMINWYRAGIRYRKTTFANKELSNEKIKVPTAIIWGANDFYLSRNMVEQSAKMCEQCNVFYIEEATHWVHREYPQQVNELIKNFLCKVVNL
ncbi:alpha/beta fold hydrolase [Candidatus Uabimicrobium sp. HlEnr_7]|uniref:alpha/beta fold hydrolase n=1 Tax=Candidatus Uabimicrobium helgolandensis TaxID=3095367 RepID=UPI0035570484